MSDTRKLVVGELPAARALVSPLAVVASLSSISPGRSVTLPFFLAELASAGFINRRNLEIEDTSAEGRLPSFGRAADAIRKKALFRGFVISITPAPATCRPCREGERCRSKGN